MTRRIALGLLLGLAPACGGPDGGAVEPQGAVDSGLASLESGSEEPATVFHGRAHGVAVEIRVVGGEWDLVSTAQRRAFAELSRLEDVVNLWDPASELARWNDGPPAGGRVSAELAELVALALDLCRATGGAFDPTVGALLAARGHYGEPVPLEGSPEELVGCDRVRLVETADGPVLERLHPGVRLDLSGLAKGWAADRVKAQLVAAGVTNALVDLGSSTIVAWGPGPDGRGWAFRHATADMVHGEGSVLRLRDECIAVSGRTPRAVDPADLTGVHLVEPGEARFVEEAPLFALARGRDSAACDAWATAALVSDALPPAGGDPTVWIVRSLGSRTLEVPGTDPPEPQTTR